MLAEVINPLQIGTGGECKFSGACEHKHACRVIGRESLDRLPECDRELGINAVVDFWSVERHQSHCPPVLHK